MYSCKILQRGEFSVNAQRFNMDPDREASRVAMEFLELIRRESHVSEIEKVIFNGDHDITELVKQLDNAPLPDLDLPF